MSGAYEVDRHQVALRKAREAITDLPKTSMLENGDMEASIAAYLSASNQVLVPREPTEEMHDKWEEGYSNGFDDLPDTVARLSRVSAYHCFKKAHESMIAAAPNPFSPQEP